MKEAKCISCKKKIQIDKYASLNKCKCDDCRGYVKVKKETNCIHCGVKLNKYSQRRFCSQSCQLEYQYFDYIDKWKSGLVDGCIGKKKVTSRHIRRYLFEKYNSKCCLCGWNEVNPVTNNVPLEVNHINGHWTDNVEDNLNLLCPNCHSLTPTQGILNKGNGRRKQGCM